MWSSKAKAEHFLKHPKGRDLLVKWMKRDEPDKLLVAALFVFKGAEEVQPSIWDKWR